MADNYHIDDFESHQAWQDEAFRLGYDSAEQRETILDSLGDVERLDAARDLINERFDQGDFQSLGDIYSDLWDSLDNMDPREREDFINDLFGYEAA
jgi:hypothetical protein